MLKEEARVPSPFRERVRVRGNKAKLMSMQTMAMRARTAAHSELGWSVALAALCLFLLLAAPGKVVNGLLLGSMIALGAIGITLIYSILRFAHVAHGDYMTLGAYITLFLLTVALPALGIEGQGFGPFTFGYPLLIALPITVVICCAIAIAIDFTVYERLRERGTGLVMLAMVSLGIAIAVRGVIQMLWGTEPLQLPRQTRPFYHLDFEIALPAGGALPFDIRVPPDNIFLGLTAIVLVGALYLFLNRTRIGKAMRATSDNIDLARVTGINTTRIIHWTWAIAAAYAAIAGTLIAVSQAQMLPNSGWNTLIPLFAAVTLGGIGKPWGALVGGLLTGVSMEVSTEWISPAYKPAVAFTIMLLVLLVRPRGLYGDRES